MDAAGNGLLSKVKELVEVHGADVNTTSRSLSSALMFAARKGDLCIAAYLLEKGADTSLTNIDKDTAFSIAQKKGHDDLTTMIAKLGSHSI